MTTTHAHVLLYLAVFAGLAWSTFWLWVYWMAFKVLRWTYLEKRQTRRAPKQQWTTPAAPAVRSWG